MKPDRRRLSRLAWFIVALHAVGLAVAGLGMRPGTPILPLAERRGYLAQAPLGWSLGWGVWMLCALAMVAFLALLAERLTQRPAIQRLSLALATAGLAVDWLCETIQISLLPALAAEPSSVPLFLAAERAAGAAGFVVANGLYSIAVLLMTLGLRSSGAPATVLTSGFATFASGMGMVAAGFSGSPSQAEWSTAPTVVVFCLWTISAARHLDRSDPAN